MKIAMPFGRDFGLRALRSYRMSLAYRVADAHALRCPDSQAKSVETLSRFLTKRFDDPFLKARAIYRWTAEHISYDVESFLRIIPRRPQDAVSVLESRLAVCEGYAAVYESLAREAGLWVREIGGVVLPSVGFSRPPLPHAWNAVRLNRAWYLIDATFGSGVLIGGSFRHRFDSFYFAPKPSILIRSHFPDHEAWQLLPKAVTSSEFYERQRKSR